MISSMMAPAFQAIRQPLKRSNNVGVKSFQSMRFQSIQPKSRMPKMSTQEFQHLYRKRQQEKLKMKNRSIGLYASSLGMVFLTLAFGSVPLYRAICQKTGWSGTPMTDVSKMTPDKLLPVDTSKKIRVQFTAETSGILPWKFVPQQREVYVTPGETALAFYKAKNESAHDIIGMATYSVTPDHVAPYFNKIQCFCFEEQKLAAGEEVDMPLFFFIDPEFMNDPSMRNIDDIVLHYTFFKANYGQNGQLMTSPLIPR
ncbi:BA75_05036T0 [Komagataella pastoris]|uniref:BA75_05036T0 n=1 Tax=Komagataella pastoris TaxID=4922 RepID=A0A1B2JIX8_PICPA|nr:BA75_05036T0 [Komagataella pastoris]